MLKVNVKSGQILEMQVSGVLPEIGAELLAIIGIVYKNLEREEDKEEFAHNMTELLPACFMNEEEKMEFLLGENEDAKAEVEELLDQLEELKNLLKELKQEKKDETVDFKA